MTSNFKKKIIVIKAQSSWIKVNFIEIFEYIDLIKLLVKRDFVTFYKQTILGPLWYVIQPIVMSIVFTFVFGNIAKIETDGIPNFLFYLCGMLPWFYFSSVVTENSTTFLKNKELFGKVYFPRLAIPISSSIINLIKLIIQFFIFLFFYFYYLYNGYDFSISVYIVFLPLLILQLCMLSVGLGILISSLTTKYRDLTFALGFFIQLFLYATPIVYPLSLVSEKYKFFLILNPMTSVVESFKLMFFGISAITFSNIILSIIITTLVFIFGFITFNKIERTFMDTI